MNNTNLVEKIRELGLPEYRIRQIQKAVYKDGAGSYEEITVLSKDMRTQLTRELPILSFTIDKVLTASDGNTIKALVRLHDDKTIETVLIQTKPGMWSACISSQAGCAMACAFCATGAAGFKRNLTSEEITDQILFWRQYRKAHGGEGTFSNIVYMGMGEPFANWPQVSQSVKELTDPELFGFGSRGLSISTSGLPAGIIKLAKEFPQVNLALSLHFATDEKRLKYMPVHKMADLAALKKALQEYFSLTNRKVFIEYLMLNGVNDTPEDARMLGKYLLSIAGPHLLHVNLIPYNATPAGLRPSEQKTMRAFRDILEEQHVSTTIRKSMGQDIEGACGQLSGKADNCDFKF